MQPIPPPLKKPAPQEITMALLSPDGMTAAAPPSLRNLRTEDVAKIPFAFQKEACHYSYWKPKG
jgi:hypothetical protein